jgi:RNA polymerase sigma-70 factor, ECF subfamily
MVMADDLARMPSGDATAYIPASSADRKGEASPDDVRTLDRGLVRRAQEGDRDAFGRLFRLHHAALFRMVRFALGSGGVDAEDAAAETFARAWKALPSYRDTGVPFVSWLYGIARHVVADEHRRAKQTEPRDKLPDRGHEEVHDDRLDLAAAIARLPQEQRLVIEMKYFAGLTNPEVAALLGTTTGAVNARQWRALKTLHETVGGR